MRPPQRRGPGTRSSAELPELRGDARWALLPWALDSKGHLQRRAGRELPPEVPPTRLVQRFPPESVSSWSETWTAELPLAVSRGSMLCSQTAVRVGPLFTRRPAHCLSFQVLCQLRGGAPVLRIDGPGAAGLQALHWAPRGQDQGEPPQAGTGRLEARAV